MAAFESARFFPIKLADLKPVADDVAENFRVAGFEVAIEPTLTQGYLISLSKGNWVKAVLGLRMALNVTIEPSGNGTAATAKVGVFAQQALPMAIYYVVFTPIILAQLWVMVQSSKLDDEAMACIERSLQAHAKGLAAIPGVGKFCHSCGAVLPGSTARFCPECGATQQ